MQSENPLQQQSEIRSILIQAEFALKENRYEEAVAMLSNINMEEMARLSMDELQAIGKLLNYLKEIAQQKKDELIEQLKTVQACKKYIG